jgi:hypothetical protein
MWLPKHTLEKKRWLLTDGSVVDEPALEETSTGRKVRVAGTDLSAFSRDIDDLLIKAVRGIAQDRGAQVWMPVHDAQRATERQLGFQPDKTVAEVYVLKTDRAQKTRAWWKFRHTTLPIEAYLVIEAGYEQPRSNTSHHEVRGRIVTPDTRANTQDVAANVIVEEGFSFNDLTDNLEWDQRTKIREFIRDNPPAQADLAPIMGVLRYGVERLMIEDVLKRVRLADGVDTIQIPDLRDPDNPAWLDLELYETNVNGNFMAELAEYLEGTPSVARALELYRDLQSTLRTLGLNLSDRSEDDFTKGLLAGVGNRHLDAQVLSPAGEGQGVDPAHTLTMDLASGTFVVNCSLSVNQNVVADRWDEVKTIASLTGEDDVLLAFAKEYVRRENEARAKKIIKERRQ